MTISTKKNNLVTNRNTRKSRKKSQKRYQYGGSSDVLKKISNRRIQKSVPSELSSISSEDFSSLSREQQKAALKARRNAIRSKKLAERKKKRKLKHERQSLKTKKQKALKAQKLAREKAKKKKSIERKKEREEKEAKQAALVTPGVQQMGMVPGMGMQQQPYGMAPGAQPGMIPMGMSPAMMALTGVGAQGQLQIAPGMTSIDAIDESSLEEMVSMLKNFEGNDYEQTSRLILTEDVYTTFNTAFNKLQQVIETVYKINQETLNSAIKDRLDRDIKKRKKIHDRAVKAEMRSKQIEHLRSKREEERRSLGLFAVTKPRLIAQPVEAMVEQAKTERLDKQSIKKIIDFLILFAKYPQLFILSKHMMDFKTPITIQDFQTESKSKIRKPNIILRFESSTTDLGNRLPKLGFLQLSEPLGGEISSLFTPKTKAVNQSGGGEKGKGKGTGLLSRFRRQSPLVDNVDVTANQLQSAKGQPVNIKPITVSVKGGTQPGRRRSTNDLPPPPPGEYLMPQSSGGDVYSVANPVPGNENTFRKHGFRAAEFLGANDEFYSEFPGHVDPLSENPGHFEEHNLEGQGGRTPSSFPEQSNQNTIVGGPAETASGDQATASGGTENPPVQPRTAGGPEVTTDDPAVTADVPEGPPPVSAVSGTKTQNNSEVNYRESILELLENQVYETLFLLLNDESIKDIKSNKSDFSTFKNEVLTLKYKILNKENYFVITRQNLEELPKENLPPSLVANNLNNLNKCLILKNQDDDGIYFFTNLDEEGNTLDLEKIRTELNSYKLVVVCKNRGGEKLTDSGFKLGFANTVKTTIFSCKDETEPEQPESLDHYILSHNYSLDDRKTVISPFLIDSNNTIIDTLNASEVEKQITNMKDKLESVFNEHIKKQCEESFLSILDAERRQKLEEVIVSQPSTLQTPTPIPTPPQTGGNLRVSHNDGSVGQSFSQQCFWISIVDWILVSKHEQTLVNLQIRFPDDFGESLSNKDTFTKNREVLLSAIKGLTTTGESQKYRDIIPNNQQTHVEGGENSHKKVIQDFVDRTGLYIDVFNINPDDNTKLLLPEDVEDIQSEIKAMRNNQTNITRLQKDMDRVMNQIEKLKDKVRANGSH